MSVGLTKVQKVSSVLFPDHGPTTLPRPSVVSATEAAHNKYWLGEQVDPWVHRVLEFNPE